MHKIDGDGATAQNEFTEGDASNNVPATVVTAAFMNDVQNDLINILTEMGIAPVKGTQTQLFAALLEFQKRGGRKTQVTQAIVNNQSSAADITDFPTFNKTLVKGIEFMYRVYRSSASGVKTEMGRAYLIFDDQADAWIDPSGDGYGGDAGIAFKIAATGTANVSKLQYISDDLTGASYSGTLKITDIKEIRV